MHIHYLHHALNRQLNALYITTMIRGLAGGMLVLFTPLYFFKLGWSIQLIAVWFFVVYIISALTDPLGGKIVGKIGFEKTIALSTPLLLLFYACLFYMKINPMFFWLAGITVGIFKGLYWVAYHSDFATSGDPKNMGEEVGLIRVTLIVIGIITPALGGYIISQFGFPTLFIIAGTLVIISLIPISLVMKKWKPIKITYKNTIEKIKSKKYRTDLTGHIGTGENLVAQAMWPIWLFLIIPNYQDIGMLTSITIFFTFIVMLWMGKLANHKNKAKLIKRSAGAVIFGWIARMFAFTPFSVFFADAIYKVSAKSLEIPYVAISYTRTNRKKIIEYTTFWMMSVDFGKALSAIIIFIVLTITNNILYTFIVAALFALAFLTWRDNFS